MNGLFITVIAFTELFVRTASSKNFEQFRLVAALVASHFLKAGEDFTVAPRRVAFHDDNLRLQAQTRAAKRGSRQCNSWADLALS